MSRGADTGLDPIFSEWRIRYGMGCGCMKVPNTSEAQALLASSGFTPSEFESLNRFRHPSRRAAWIAGRIAARSALRDWMSRVGSGEPESCEILNAPSGAPFFREHPDLHLSISHAGSVAVAIVAGQAAGIDIELFEARPESFVRSFFSSSERSWIGDSEPERSIRCTIGWTRKEAISKLLGKGGSIAFAGLPILEDETEYQLDSRRTSSHAISIALVAET